MPLFASTWYVRPDGGTRYTALMPKGQCDGTADAPYPGSGTNRHCAFKDVRFFWQDGSYPNASSFPSWGWIGEGGDTYLIRGSLATGVSYRLGWNNNANAQDPSTSIYYGIPGDPYRDGMPVPLSGTAAHRTRILGENYASCHAAAAKTQLHGGYGAYSVMNMSGASYVDVACLDITDFSSCGRSSQPHDCNTSPGTLSDFANNGIRWSNKSTNDTLTDVHVHGLAGSGMYGPTGDGIVLDHVDLIGNAGSGWNADAGDHTTGTGSLLVKHFNISWNGCAEEYPMVHALPYNECTDDSSGGYGDGFGTASMASIPAWHVTFDDGVASYNTQDGLDALHIEGAGSSMTVTHTLAYGNMGQQIKVGGSSGNIIDNQIVTNCNAMRQRIPGTPEGYNTRLSDFCRAADAGVAIEVNNNMPLRFDGNTIYTASITTIEIDCSGTSCDSAAKIDFRNNTFIGFKNDAAHGYPSGGQGEYSNLIYIGAGTNPFQNAGSVVSGNLAYFPNKPSQCSPGYAKVACRNPHLVDQSWHLYGYGNMTPGGGTQSEVDSGANDSQSSEDVQEPSFHIHHPVRILGGVCAGVLVLAAWRGSRYFQNRD